MFREAINNLQATWVSRILSFTKSVKDLTMKISFLFVEFRTTLKAKNFATLFLRKTSNVQ